MSDSLTERIHTALDRFEIETPSWGFADGTRFGKFLQDAAAIDINDKLADAGQVHWDHRHRVLRLIDRSPPGVERERNYAGLVMNLGVVER